MYTYIHNGNLKVKQSDNLVRKTWKLTLVLIFPPSATMYQYELKFVRGHIVVPLCWKLWKENTPYYNDALQQTWLYFCRNPEQYKPEHCSVITWLDNCLKWRLKDFRSKEASEQVRTISAPMQGTEKTTDRIENLPASPDIPPILEETYEWAEADLDGELRSTHVKGRPDVTCQILILRRLPPETPWKTIAKEFNLSPSTAPNFYKRECLPRLRNFALRQGYLT